MPRRFPTAVILNTPSISRTLSIHYNCTTWRRTRFGVPTLLRVVTWSVTAFESEEAANGPSYNVCGRTDTDELLSLSGISLFTSESSDSPSGFPCPSLRFFAPRSPVGLPGASWRIHRGISGWHLEVSPSEYNAPVYLHSVLKKLRLGPCTRGFGAQWE